MRYLGMVAAVVLAALSMYALPSLIDLMRSPAARSRAMAALHAAHFDSNIRPSRHVRRAMHKRLSSLWLLPEAGSVTLPTLRDATPAERQQLLRAGIITFSGGSGEASVLEEDLSAEKISDLSLDTLKKMRATGIEEGNKLAERADSLTRDERKQMRGILANLAVLGETIAEREGDDEAIKMFREAKAAEDKARQALMRQSQPEIYDPAGARKADFKTPGEMFIESDAYKAHRTSGFEGPSGVAPYPEMSGVLGLRDATKAIKARAIITASDTVAGDLSRPQFIGFQDQALLRPLTIRDIVTVIPTDSDAIEYVQETSRVSGAAPVAEATASTGSSGTKPEAGLVFDVRTTTIKTIAEWVAATTRILADAPMLRGYIDQYLLYDLALELEDQIISGDGTGENFTGILNTVGIQTQAAPVAPASNLDGVRKAITQVELNGRTRPTAVVLHPTDSQNLDLLKVNAEANRFVTDPFNYNPNSPIWGLPRVVTDGITAGTYCVGDFRRAVLFNRQAAQIRVGTVNDDFIRNIVRVLAELRAGFAVLRPAAFVKGTFA